jgi:hypothetical protein
LPPMWLRKGEILSAWLDRDKETHPFFSISPQYCFG